MSIDLDPEEVLQHLYSLGYYNITKEQFKDFIKDLKKLIKYDLRKQERLSQSPQEYSLKSNKENVCSNLSRNDTSSYKHFGSRHRENVSPHHYGCNNKSEIPEKLVEKKSGSPKKHVHLKPSLSHLHICQQCHCALDCDQPCSSKVCVSQSDKDDTDTGSTSEESENNNCKVKRKPKKPRQQANVKPCPSFIRTSTTKSKPPPKADPVALYHYYKTLWSQHTLPGENSHEDLRWRIRHKMNAPPVLTKTHNEPGKKPEWVPS